MKALVIGGSSGIGKCVAEKLHSQGHEVYSAARHTSGAPYQEYEMDVRFPHTIAEVIAQIPSLDALIYSAGIGLASPAEETKREDYVELFDVNLFGLFESVKLALPKMNSGGRIVAISSMAGCVNVPYNSYYCASKAALNSYIAGLNMEIKQKGLSATAIMPGGTRTSFTYKRKKYCSDKYSSALNCSVTHLGKDEQGGAEPTTVAEKVVSALLSALPPVLLPVTIGCKAAFALERIIPKKIAEHLLEAKYLNN